jgi:outer membrane protein
MEHRKLRWTALALALGLMGGAILGPQGLYAQQSGSATPTSLNYTRADSFPHVLGAYSEPMVPQPRMSNSDRLRSLIHDGKLTLSLQDVIALALENNLDIDVARYGLAYAQTDLLRTRSGGSNRGINPSLFGGVSTFAGGAAGGGRGSGGGAGGITGGGTVSQVSQVGCCDPVAGVSFGWNQSATPLNFTVVSGIPVANTHTSATSVFYGQGFMTGTSYVVALFGTRQSSDELNQLFNPYISTGMQIGFNQHLLNGFGYRANAKFLRIAQNDVRQADSVFRQQVITTVGQVLNLYYDLLAFRENVRVAERSLALAEKTLSDNKRQVEIGTLAPIEVVRAEAEVAARQQDLIVAQTNLQEQQTTLKTALAKVIDPELAAATIEPTDTLPDPKPGDIPPLDEALKEAAKNRPEIEQAEIDLRNQSITIKAGRNALLPTLDVFATYGPQGLEGNSLVGPAGFGDSLSQTFHGNYPSYSVGLSFTVPIRNRTARADAATNLLQERQLRVREQQTRNQIDQQVRNAEIALIQAKAQIEAASKSVVLEQQTLDAEQKKFQLGESTVINVIQTQRDLAAAEGTEVTARSTYAKALTQMEQSTGTILAKNNIELAEAKQGRVNRNLNIPGTPIQPPAHQGLGGLF